MLFLPWLCTCKQEFSAFDVLIILYSCFFPQMLWEGYVCDPKINKDGKTWEVEPLNYQRDVINMVSGKHHLYAERVTVHIHAVNKKIAKDPRVLVNILPIGSGLTIATKL